MAIGFNTNEIQKCVDDTEKEIGYWKFARCKYGLEKDKVRGKLEELIKLRNANNPEIEEKTKAFLTERAITKNEAYEYEKEWRLYKIFHKLPREAAPNRKRYVHQYREVKGLIIPYEEIPIPVSAIQEIIIGPTAHLDRAFTSVEMFLESRGIQTDFLGKNGAVRISKSKVPYILI